MQQRILILSLIAACHGNASAAQRSGPAPKAGGFTAQFLGEGGGPAHSDGAASDYQEHSARQEAGHGTFTDRAPAEAKPTPQPSAPVNARPQPRSAPAAPTAKAPSEGDRDGSRTLAAPPRAPEEDRRDYSLWQGLNAPLELPSDKVLRAPPDQASQLVRRDYETHILGAKPGAAPGPESSPLPSYSPEPAQKAGEVFVALDLNLKGGAVELRDAVAGLSASAGFRPDARFPPTVIERDGRKIWGWLPADKVGAAVGSPSVTRLEIRRGTARPSAGGEALSPLVLGLKVPEGASTEAVFKRAMAELSAQAGFRWKKTAGSQSIPGSRDRALVVLGEAPVRSLSRIMAHGDVLKIMPAPAAEPPAAPARKSRPLPARFASYALSRSPALVALTLLAAALTLAGGLGRASGLLAAARQK